MSRGRREVVAQTPRQMELLAAREQSKAVLEALLFACDRPVPAERLREMAGGMEEGLFQQLLAELEADYGRLGRAFTVVHVAGGYQLASRPEYAPWIKRLYRSRSLARLTRSSLETLSVIAYKQPVTKAEVEGVRGVNIESVLQTLLERRFIRIVGRKDVAGRPLMYGTTIEFLQYFGLTSLADLPQLKEIDELVDEKRAIQELLPMDLDELRRDQLGSRQLLSFVERRAGDTDGGDDRGDPPA